MELHKAIGFLDRLCKWPHRGASSLGKPQGSTYSTPTTATLDPLGRAFCGNSPPGPAPLGHASYPSLGLAPPPENQGYPGFLAEQFPAPVLQGRPQVLSWGSRQQHLAKHSRERGQRKGLAQETHFQGVFHREAAQSRLPGHTLA